jgi:hypothetical protein
MAQAHANVEGIIGMNDVNPYRTAGWLSIAAAILFPLAFVISILQGLIGISRFNYTGPTIGPSDILFIIFTAFTIYALVMFRRMLNDRYNFHDIDTLITLSILWGILFQVVSISYRLIMIVLWPVPQLAYTLSSLGILVLFFPLGGTIDIIIAVRLLRDKDRFNEMIRVLAYLNMAAGICMATIVFSPLSLILMPIWWAILGMVFLREKEEAEFV